MNDVYNLDLLLGKNKENDSDSNLGSESGYYINKINNTIILLIKHINILFLLDLPFLMKINIKSVNNPQNHRKLLFFYIVFNFWCEYILISRKDYRQL